MVPMLTCGFVRSNFAFATSMSSWTVLVLVVKQCVDLCSYRSPRWQQVRFTDPSPSLSRLLDSGPAPSLGPGGPRFSLTRRFRDDLLRHLRRNFSVGIENHGVVRPALCLRPKVADVAEHLRQRHVRPYDAGTAPLLHGLDLATAGVQVADHFAHVVLGRGDLDGHDRLQDDRLRLSRTLF